MTRATIQELRRASGEYSSSLSIQGVVTGHASKGYFIQENPESPDVSCGLFIYSPKNKPAMGYLTEVTGKVSNYQARSGDKTCLQFKAKTARSTEQISLPDPITLDLDLLANASTTEVGQYLAKLEAMRVEIPAGLTCVAPSNLHGDYVVAPASWPGFCSPPDGILIDSDDPHRWIPSFRLLDSKIPLEIYVGDLLEQAVVGPLNYRASAYQVRATNQVTFKTGKRTPLDTLSWHNTDANSSASNNTESTHTESTRVSVMTLNTFNLDPKVERKNRVKNPQLDIDDDVGQRQYRNLAQAIIDAGCCPDIVALQEIQDDDGAEISQQNSAHKNLSLLVAVIKDLSGVDYKFLDSPPELNAEGGQPGGNIRNAFLYRAEHVELDGKLIRLGESASAFEDSRKPVMATFRNVKGNSAEVSGLVSIINVHLASKRHQHSIFADDQPGFDPRESQRIAQCEVIERTLQKLNDTHQNYYVTGDFNDYEFSPSLRALTADHSINLVDTLPPEQRYDYNHRGRLLALMHGIISKRQCSSRANRYQILHGNEFQPADPNNTSSDHAYVLAELNLT